MDWRFDIVSGSSVTPFKLDAVPGITSGETQADDWLFIIEASNGTFTERIWFRKERTP